jgi:thiol-disulfide isomerase/thioredoxin
MVLLPTAIAAIALSGAGQTVLLEFYGDHCGPCRAMQPTVQGLINARYPVQQINVEKRENAGLVAQYRVGPIPCFVMLVDGREVGRVVGSNTTFSQLERMCKLGVAPAPANPSPVIAADHIAPLPTPPVPTASPLSAPFDGWPNQPAANQPVAFQQRVPGPPSVSDAALVAATVRLRVEDVKGYSCGSGTIIDARQGQALILTCGHIFRDARDNGRIDVDLFGPNGIERVEGRHLWHEVPSLDGAGPNSKADLGLVAIRAPRALTTAPVAPPGYHIQPGMAVVSVGCNNGNPPTARRSQIASLDKFVDPPNIEVADEPVEGRSGGGLFSSEGYLIGVCNAADPRDKEGLFAALPSIHAALDRTEMAFVYRSPSAAGPVAPASFETNVASDALAALSKQPRSRDDRASTLAIADPTAEATPKLAPQEQAALDEIRRRKKEGSEIIFVVRPRNNPDAKSEVFMLNQASPEFLRQLVGEIRPQPGPHLTSLELPKPRRILLEWSADGKSESGERR